MSVFNDSLARTLLFSHKLYYLKKIKIKYRFPIKWRPEIHFSHETGNAHSKNSKPKPSLSDFTLLHSWKQALNLQQLF